MIDYHFPAQSSELSKGPLRVQSVAAFARISSILWSLLAGGALAEETVYETLQAATADPDFAVQGEYVGDRLGVQVVALGRGEFQVANYAGGLPGAGWDRGERQTEDADREEVAKLVVGLKKVERTSPTLGKKPPAGAVVLFDGTRESLIKHWTAGARATDDRLLAQGCTSVDTFRDFSMHLEFRLPFMPLARGQGRGNSGAYYQGRYETQILDSFGLEGTDHECGGFYDIAAPILNMCLPPLSWQTYDVEFTAARWDDQEKKTANARLTVWLNGVLVHQEVEMPGATLAAPLTESPEPGPIHLQEHGSPVRYRNIWVVPRDAEREARRPIVPGFETFHAAAATEAAEGGRLLIGELNCTACHVANAALTARLPPRPAPVLDEVGGRVRPEYLLRFIADPHGTKPGTTMPSVFANLPTAERDAAVRAIVNFLATTGKLREQAGSRQFAANGEKLFHQIGCVACHALRNDGSVPLIALAEKYTIPALAAFLKDPHHARPAGRMPSLNLNPDEARDLACYLIGDVDYRPGKPNLRYAVFEGSWEKVPDFSQLVPVSVGESAGLDLNVAGRTSNFGVRFEGFLPIEFEGRYIFHLGSDDGSKLSIDGNRVVDCDGAHPHQVRSNSAALAKGLHPIRVDYMQGGGEWTLELEYEGPEIPRQPADLLCRLTEQMPPEVPQTPWDSKEFVFDASQVEKGRELFASLGCAACHALKQGDQPLVAFAAPRPLADCDPAKGCLAGAPARPVVDFALGQVQRESLAKALAASSPVEPPTATERIERTMTAFNCFACHARGGVGGPTHERNELFLTTIPEMGDEGRLPPPLDGVGDKLEEGWLRHVLADGSKDRPYVLTRMPCFGHAAVARLADDFIALDRAIVHEGTNDGPTQGPAEPLHRVKATGRQLVGDKALACVKCHTFGSHRATGIQAIDLLTMTRRVRRDWFQRYLVNPALYRPGTRMPSGFVNGRGTITAVYDGHPERQIAAIWAYLSDGEYYTLNYVPGP
ncbi:MAG TPA: family 16 glycoside hydrolase [Pirellulales bacterium]|nr:family 16 glycoside hydrolase [Pirellulales bacterium]